MPGSGLRRLTDYPGTDGFPAWSPAGAQIPFASTRNNQDQRSDRIVYRIYIMNADGSEMRRLTETYGQFVDWSPDGRYLVVAGDGGLKVITPDGSATASIPVDASLPLFPDSTP